MPPIAFEDRCYEAGRGPIEQGLQLCDVRPSCKNRQDPLPPLQDFHLIANSPDQFSRYANGEAALRTP